MESYYTNLRPDVVSIIPSGDYSRALEIGGGDFPTLMAVKDRYGIDAWGVDIRACNNPAIKFIQGSIEDDAVVEQLPDGAFDLVLANDVIEHLVDTAKFFQTASSKLCAHGLLVLSVPNIRQLRALYHIFVRGRFPRDEAGLFDRTHLRWFCKKDVVELAQQSGMRLKSARSVGRLVPSIISTTLLAELLALQNIFVFQK